MSELRKHLRREMGAYQATRYPGDLGREILPQQVLEYRRPEIWRHPLWRIVGVAVAAAAMIAIAIPVWHKLTATAPQVAARPEVQQEDPAPIAMDQTESMPDDVEDLPLAPNQTGGFVPEYQSMSFPTIPSFLDSPTTDQNNQPSKESA